MTVNTPLKIVIAVVAMILIVTIFHFLDWKGKMDEIESCKANISSLETKLEEQKQLVAELPKLTREKAELEEELNRVLQTNLVAEKPELFVANYIKEVEKLTMEEAYNSGDRSFEIISITPGALTSQTADGAEANAGDSGEDSANAEDSTPDALKQFPTRMFQMTMKGRYSTLVKFLYQLGDLKLERLVTINKISLQPESSKEKNAGSPVLQIQIPITAYMRQGG
ncbi:type 4a pilus biogenesis protein PilO [bacterium]|nr:type 4a pilus biogenesis protein PilO [bacterium]